MKGWTQQRLDLLEKLTRDGLSASNIARELGGGLTRNAVIGKASRLGLRFKAAPGAQKKEAAPKPAAPLPLPTQARGPGVKVKAGVKPKAPAIAPRVETPAPPIAVAPRDVHGAALEGSQHQALASPAFAASTDKANVRLVDLAASSCRWPLGDPRAPAFRFCGAARIGGCSYCAAHRAIAYVRRPQPQPTAPGVYVPRKRISEASDGVSSARRRTTSEASDVFGS